MGSILATLFAPLLLQQGHATPAAAPAVLDSGLVIASATPATGRAFALGDGGIDAGKTGALHVEPGEATTPGGVFVQCRREGVKLTFPSGREVLFAPDGFAHLRDGGAAGPFAGGVELRLGDGSLVQVALSNSRRAPLGEVTVVAAGEAVRLWQRNGPVREAGRDSWQGDRVFCLGDGGALYRALALGPVVSLQRLLAPRGTALPEARLVLQPEPLLASLQQLAASHSRLVDPDDIAQVQLVIDNAATVLPADGPPPPRTGTSPLVFLLRAGYDLKFELVGADLRMAMARHGERPFVEWQLGYGASVACAEASLQPKGSLVTLPPVAPELQPRLQRLDLARALEPFRLLMRQ